jgi:hypothetical protein
MLPTAPQLQVPPFSYSTPVPVIGQVDPKFEPQTEWNKEYIDEYIGGIW